jgi:hypothetical protein
VSRHSRGSPIASGVTVDPQQRLDTVYPTSLFSGSVARRARGLPGGSPLTEMTSGIVCTAAPQVCAVAHWCLQQVIIYVVKHVADAWLFPGIVPPDIHALVCYRSMVHGCRAQQRRARPPCWSALPPLGSRLLRPLRSGRSAAPRPRILALGCRRRRLRLRRAQRGRTASQSLPATAA